MLVALFSAVNESSWEHLKLAVFPSVIWAFLEWNVFKLKANNFSLAKAASVYLAPILIIVFFYSYRAFLPDNFIFDISIFILAVAIGQFAGYRLMARAEFSKRYNLLFLSLILVLALAFFIFTFYPPHIFLFQDPVSGGYGIAN